MEITNHCSFPVVAFGYHTDRGYGDGVEIPPGETRLVSGPYLGKMGGGSCWVHIPGEITVHEGPDDDEGFCVTEGEPLALQEGKIVVTVRCKEDELEDVL